MPRWNHTSAYTTTHLPQYFHSEIYDAALTNPGEKQTPCFLPDSASVPLEHTYLSQLAWPHIQRNKGWGNTGILLGSQQPMKSQKWNPYRAEINYDVLSSVGGQRTASTRQYYFCHHAGDMQLYIYVLPNYVTLLTKLFDQQLVLFEHLRPSVTFSFCSEYECKAGFKVPVETFQPIYAQVLLTIDDCGSTKPWNILVYRYY